MRISRVMAQTYNNIEIILVNDGSQDNSLSICSEYAKKDSRIKVIDRLNEGVSAARNAGIECASGDYITFVDADDIIEPFMYQILLEQMKRYEVDISQSGVVSKECLLNHIVIESNDIKILSWRDAIIDLLDSGSDFTCSVWNKLYKRELFEGIRSLYEHDR